MHRTHNEWELLLVLSDQIAPFPISTRHLRISPAGSDFDRHAAATSRFDHRQDNSHIF